MLFPSLLLRISVFIGIHAGLRVTLSRCSLTVAALLMPDREYFPSLSLQVSGNHL